ncbi:MAG: replicative DNA helicase [Chitinophagales bacterium]|nr:replicative DNA helicase [Chitinophagales bacterium]
MRPRTDPDDSPLLYGRIPPQALDLEEAVLGALMLERDAAAAVIDILKPESFYLDAHQCIYAAIRDLFDRSQPIDLLTVTEELRRRGELDRVGGPLAVTALTQKVASAANVEFHARIVAQKYIQRELIGISSDIIKAAYEDTTDVFDLLDFAERKIYEITDKNLRRSYYPLSDLMVQAVKQLKTIREHKDAVTGVPAGFAALDHLTNGWQNSDLIIVAARPGMGKTSFVLSLARNAAIDHEKAVAFFSLEMSALQLTQRLIAAETGIPAEKIRRGGMEQHEWEQLIHQTNQFSRARLFIDDTPAINIFELRAKARRLKMQHDISLIILDYLQLMSGTGEQRNANREQEISNISRALKSIAKELNIPIIALSQLNRSVEVRGGDKRPQLSDLRESGAIEQDADLVLFIYRPEYYKITQDAEGNDTTGMAEIIVAKHRNGAVGSVKVRFIHHLAKFTDEDPYLPAGFARGVRTVPSRMNELPDEEDKGDSLDAPIPW